MKLIKLKIIWIFLPLFILFVFILSTLNILAFNELKGTWIKVSDLEVGDYLKTVDGWQEIISIDRIEEQIDVYNMSVTEPNTFWANGILAHNKGTPPVPGGPDCEITGPAEAEEGDIITVWAWQLPKCNTTADCYWKSSGGWTLHVWNDDTGVEVGTCIVGNLSKVTGGGQIGSCSYNTTGLVVGNYSVRGSTPQYTDGSGWACWGGTPSTAECDTWEDRNNIDCCCCSGAKTCDRLNFKIVDSCDIEAWPVFFNGVNDLKNANINVIDPGSSDPLQRVLFTINNTTVVEIEDPTANPDSASPYSLEMRSLSTNTTYYTAEAFALSGDKCDEDTASIVVNPALPWYQVVGGDAITDGDIGSLVPDGSMFMEEVVASSPGVPIAGGDVNVNPARVSSTGWMVEGATYAGDLPSYDNFWKKISSKVTPTPLDGSADKSELTDSSAAELNDYYYFQYTGTLYIEDSADIDLEDNRVVVFVDGDVNINNKILLDRGEGFLMIIASGKIIIDESVGGSNDGVAELVGVYYSGDTFETKTSGGGLDQQLHIRGIVVTNSINLQRSIDEVDIPGEFFEYAPDQNMLIPPELSKQIISWKEVLP